MAHVFISYIRKDTPFVDSLESALLIRAKPLFDGLMRTEDEFPHILATFTLVSESVKCAAQNAYRKVAWGMLK